MRSWIRPIVICVTVVLTVVSCSDDDGEQSDSPDQTTSTSSPEGAATTSTASESTSTSERQATANVDSLEGMAWVVNDFDGLIDDQGRVLVEPSGMITGGSRLVARAGDGAIYYINGERLWRWAVDAGRSEPVDVEVDRIGELGYDNEGRVVINPHSQPVVVDEAGGRPRTSYDSPIGTETFMTASNGVTVTVTDPVGPIDPEAGYLMDVDTLAQLRVTRPDGEVEWTTDAGGTAAPWLSIIDFDGRYVMLARAPEEPADPAMQHIVYDLDCRDGGDAGDTCTTTFWARHGTATLVGPDRQPGDDRLNIQLLDICPTMYHEISPPVEMTDPELLDTPFTEADRDTFQRAATSLAVCDPLDLGVEAYALADDNDWLWHDTARALEGPFTQTDTDEWTWTRGPGRSSVVLVNEFGQPYMEFRPARRQPPGEVAAVMSTTHLVLQGQADQAFADALTSAAQQVADDRSIEIVDRVQVDGPGHDPDLQAAFLERIADDLGDSEVAAGEIHLTGDGVAGYTTSSAEPTGADETIGFTFADFASGGESAFDELRFADTVGLALGPDLVAWRDADNLVDRAWWTVNRSHFRAYVGPFNLVDQVPSPSAFAVGPHPRCGGPIPIPAPPELADYRRISILPTDDSIDSCLAWSAVDLFVDDQGVIHGVSLDLFEP